MKRNKKKLCPPSVGVYVPPVVESATMYKGGQVQSAQEYILYLDTVGRCRGIDWLIKRESISLTNLNDI